MKTNFYILVIVAINQIYNFQSSRGDFTVQLEEDENNKVKEKAAEVGKILSLTNITRLPERSKEGKTIKECFDENIENYKVMIDYLNDQITDAGNKLKNALKGKYPEQVKAAQEQLTNVAEELKQYPPYLSNELQKFAKAINRIASKSFAFRKYLEGYYVALKDIENKEKGKANEALNAYKLILEEILTTCHNTVNQIKICMGETDLLIPVKDIHNRN